MSDKAKISTIELNRQLWAAAEKGAPGRIEELLALGADPLAWEPTRSQTALTIAIASGCAECVKVLLRVSDTNAKAKSANGTTALMLAAGYGRTECFDLLLPESDVSAKDNDGWTALMWAIAGGSEESVRRLTPLSNPEETDRHGRTALMHATRRQPECLRLLLPWSDPLAQSETGCTALMEAIDEAAGGAKRSVECVRILASASDLDAVDCHGSGADARAEKMIGEAGKQIRGLLAAERERRALQATVASQEPRKESGDGTDLGAEKAKKAPSRL